MEQELKQQIMKSLERVIKYSTEIDYKSIYLGETDDADETCIKEVPDYSNSLEQHLETKDDFLRLATQRFAHGILDYAPSTPFHLHLFNVQYIEELTNEKYFRALRAEYGFKIL